MKSELAKKLKTLLDNMSQEEFDKEWSKVVQQNKEVTTDFKLLLFPMLVNLESIETLTDANEPKTKAFILSLKNYVGQMINSNAEYDKKPLKKILNKIKSFE
mgnify:CR=1 FL=1